MNPKRADRNLQRPLAPLRRLHISLKASLFLILFLMALAENQGALSDAAESLVNCRIQEGACSQSLQGLDVILDIRPKPVRAMRKLEFQVSIGGEDPARPPYIDLGMPGMVMGPNRVILERVSPSRYAGVGVIVRCPSGQRTWRATVTVPGRGKADFIFDVVY